MDRHASIVPDGHSIFQTVKVERDGIRLFGLLYDGSELARLRPYANATRWSVIAVIDPADWKRALVIMPDTFELVRLPLVSQVRPSNVLSSTMPKRLPPALRSSVAAAGLAACERVIALPRSWGRSR